MKLKLDENLGHHCALLLRNAGFDVATIVEEGLCGSSDHTVIQVCQNEKRCLITLDLDFGNPLVFNPSKFEGIVILRLPHRPSPVDLESTIKTLVDGLKKEAVTGKLWIVQKGKIREYQQEDI